MGRSISSNASNLSPPYFLDLNLLDYYLFRSLKNSLHDKKKICSLNDIKIMPINISLRNRRMFEKIAS